MDPCTASPPGRGVWFGPTRESSLIKFCSLLCAIWSVCRVVIFWELGAWFPTRPFCRFLWSGASSFLYLCSFRVMAGSFGPLTVLPISKSSVFCVFNSPGPECYLLRSPARSPHLGRFAVGLPHAAGKREALLAGGKCPAEVFHICGGNTYGWFDHGLFLHGFASRAL